MSTSGDTTPLEADLAALRKLRDDPRQPCAHTTTTQPAPQEQIINGALVNELAKGTAHATTRYSEAGPEPRCCPGAATCERSKR